MRGILAAMMLCLGFVCASGSPGSALEFQGEMLTAVGGPVSGSARPAPARAAQRVSRSRGYRTASRHAGRTGGLPSRSRGNPGDIQITAPGLVAEARRHLGATGAIVGMGRAWCGAFVDMVLRRNGYPPGSKLARAYASYGRAAHTPVPGAIVVWRHHVGIVTRVEDGGTVLVISGNDGKRVRERERSLAGVIAIRVPS